MARTGRRWSVGAYHRGPMPGKRHGGGRPKGMPHSRATRRRIMLHGSPLEPVPEDLRDYARRGLLDTTWDRDPLPDAEPEPIHHASWVTVDVANCGRQMRRRQYLDEREDDL